jgi:RimJ/RimL family protein N-acetyltransferase
MWDEEQPVLAGEGFRLRPFRHGDAEALWEAGQAEDIGRYTSIAWPFTRAAAELLIAEADTGWQAGTMARFALIGLPDERVVGTASLLHIYPERGDAEVGYWLGTAGRGQGLARRAVALVCDWAFQSLGLQRLHLMADLDNEASQAVAVACGFALVGEVFWEHPTDRSKDAVCLLYERVASVGTQAQARASNQRDAAHRCPKG